VTAASARIVAAVRLSVSCTYVNEAVTAVIKLSVFSDGCEAKASGLQNSMPQAPVISKDMNRHF